LLHQLRQWLRRFDLHHETAQSLYFGNACYRARERCRTIRHVTCALEREDDVSVPILVAPHHGSKDLDPDFAKTVGERLTLITVGAPNPYGLPAPEAVAAYAARGPVFRTDQDGRVLVCLNGTGVQVVKQR
jgi:hypothetical protein